MRSRSLTLLAIAVLAFNSAAFAVTLPSTQTTGEAELVKLLPASDAVVAVNVKRLLNEALPTLLASKPEWVAKIKAGLDDFQGKAGFDVRSIDTAVIGLNFKPTEGGKYDIQPIVLAKGSFNGGSLIALLRAADDKDIRAEKVGTHSMIIIDIKDEAKDAGDKAADAADAAGAADIAKDAAEKVDNPFADEIAIAAMPNGSVALGTVDRVRETLLGVSKLDASIAPALAKYPRTVAKFATVTPNGMSEFVPVDNDFLGNTLKSIRTLGGAMDVTPSTSTFMLSLGTELPEQAKDLFDLVDGLMTVGKNIFGASAREDQKTFLRLIEAAKLTLTENKIDLTLPVAQSDIDALVLSIKETKDDEAQPDEPAADEPADAPPSEDQN